MGSRRPGLDAVRALAILAVCASHALGVLFPGIHTGLAAFLGGGGVQAFFALSGFLTGGILFDIATAPSWGVWSTFLARRFCRTLPTFYAVLAVLAALSWPGWDTLLRVGTLTHNFAWDPATEWFAVSWSLAIEEAFYLLFASAFLLTSRLVGIHRAISPCVAIFVLCPLVIRVLLFYNGIEVGTHAALLGLDGIAYGVALAAVYRAHKPFLTRYAALFGIIGAALLYAGWHSYLMPGSTPMWMPWSSAFGAAGFTLLLIPALSIRSLGSIGRPALAIAGVSYPLYLVHLDALYFMRELHGLAWPVTLVLWMAVTAAIVFALHRLIERPAMRFRPTQIMKSLVNS